VWGLELSEATVVLSSQASPRERQAARMLVEEVERRSGVRWPIVASWPDAGAVVAVGNVATDLDFAGDKAEALRRGEPGKPESYRLIGQGGARPTVLVAGNDERGVLFGVGHLLRVLDMRDGRVTCDGNLKIDTAPAYPLRGHQLGYRPKTNSYDAWDLPIWEQYIRDLAVFGSNAVELVPPRTDDAATSPHFPLPQLPMMAGMSEICDRYGLDVWIWYPALDKDYADPATVEAAIEEWGRVYDALPRIDAIFVPGGDPGHTRPKYMMELLKRQTQRLKQSHPQAQMWMSPQSFNQEWFDEFVEIMRGEPEWLTGIVFGPQVRVSLPKLRELMPARYPIRHYPDITHSRQSQYSVPDWDTAHALTSARECINPRPVDQAAIFRLLQPYTVGFLTYSEGCNDDVNKIVWSGLGWNPEADIVEILREYSGYFIGSAYRDSFAQVLLALERNWRGPLATNAGVDVALAQLEDLQRGASPALLRNWRFQQALYRGYYDAYVRRRLLWETELEQQALDILQTANEENLDPVLTKAEAVLARADLEHVAPRLRQRTFELAEALFQSIRMQTSVDKYRAIGVDRGATLDTIDYPLNNRRWLAAQIKGVREMHRKQDKLAALARVVRWQDPGPGGFYDDLGNLAHQPHLVRGKPFAEDPASLESSKVGFEEEGENWRLSWCDHAESMLESPLRMHYDDLDPAARYTLRVVYAGDGLHKKIRLLAGAEEQIEIHPYLRKPVPVKPIEFSIPPEATRDGTLDLAWYREEGLGDNGRGCQVSEVWLVRQPGE
jgi:hypothetical protein